MRGHVTLTVIGSIIFLLLRSKLGKTATEVSKACYGSQGLQCTSHYLTCSSGRIAIQDAFYMNSTACPMFGASICYGINFTSIPLTGSRYNFSDTELGLLHDNCSTLSTCSFAAGRKRYDLIFSVITYHCINVEVSKACYGSPGAQCTKHTLRCSSGRIAIQEAFYTDSTACGPSGVSDCANINLTGIQLTGRRYNFNDTEMDSLYRDCSTQSQCTLRAYRRAMIYALSFSAIVYECNNATILKTTTPKTKLTTGREGTTPTLTSLKPSKSSSLFPLGQTTVTDIGSEVSQTVATIPTTAGTMFTAKTCSVEKNYGGIFAAGLVTGLAIAAVFAGVLYFVYIRRRCVIKEPNPGPASPNHSTYTGLTDLARPETYDVIVRPEAVSRSAETSQAAVYQNVDNAS